MATQLVFETHATSEDNERGVASGWLQGRLSQRGRTQAQKLGSRRRDDGISAVVSSDLRRARESAEIAFEKADIPVFLDWRLRECDYGDRNGTRATEIAADRKGHLDVAHPDGESWRQAVERVCGALDDIARRWPSDRVLVIGHVATRWALACRANGQSLEELAAETFVWRAGWEYLLEPHAPDGSLARGPRLDQ